MLTHLTEYPIYIFFSSATRELRGLLAQQVERAAVTLIPKDSLHLP